MSTTTKKTGETLENNEIVTEKRPTRRSIALGVLGLTVGGAALTLGGRKAAASDGEDADGDDSDGTNGDWDDGD